ncbi:MAG: TauD/TfdA family dioxygenase, partial [Alphaproteobacteria bacterium]|nr:TauD/TfdA family dioxygenase [Alphaproteobacteria bacterium]
MTMPAMPSAPLTGPLVWQGASFASDDSWVHRLSPAIVAEMERVVRAANARGLRAPNLRREDVPLPAFAAAARRIQGTLENGCGFAVVRGIDMALFSREEARTLFFAVGLQLGSVVSQNAFGDVLDLGLNPDDPNVRFYQTTRAHDFHNDQSDCIGLMCQVQAKQGGESSLVGACALHNQIMAERPDLLRVLYQPFVIDRRGERGRPEEGDVPYYALPVFSW